MIAASMAPNPVAAVMKIVEEKEKEEFASRLRPEEDPELVGHEAAEAARKKRLGKWGNEVLMREDKRWDWLIGTYSLASILLRCCNGGLNYLAQDKWPTGKSARRAGRSLEPKLKEAVETSWPSD